MALLSWTLVVSLVLGMSVPAYASSPQSLFTTWEGQSANRANYEAYDRSFCSDFVVGRGITALSALRKAGGYAGSYSKDNVCMDVWGGWNDLETSAQTDWQDCRMWVDANLYMRGWDINVGNGYAHIAIGVTVFVLGVVVGSYYGDFINEYRARRDAQDMICGASVRG